MENNQYGFVEVEKFQAGGKTYERFSHRTGGLTYFLALILPQLIGGSALLIISLILAENSDGYLFFAYFITQAVMALALLVAVNFKIKETLPRLHVNMPIKKADIWLMIPLSVALILGLNFLPSIFLLLMENFGYVMQEIPFPDTTTAMGFILGVVCICIMPAIVEESIFRGVILRSFSQKSAWKGILISSALFALMHGSAQQTVYQFVVGVILGLVAIKSNSILPSMILHMLNNLISLGFLFFSDAMAEAILVYGFAPALALVMIFIWYYNRRETPKIVETEEKIEVQSVNLQDDFGRTLGMSRDISVREDVVKKGKKYQAIIFYSSGILFGVVVWISALILGF